jgi:hypothetical protein
MIASDNAALQVFLSLVIVEQAYSIIYILHSTLILPNIEGERGGLVRLVVACASRWSERTRDVVY